MVKQERAARTRRSLVQAAAEMFARDGFEPASLTTICRMAGVSSGALHFHFETKDRLALAVEDEAAGVLRRIEESVAAGRHGALQQLIDGTHRLLVELDGDVVVRAGFELSGDGPRLVAGEGRDVRGQWRGWVERVLADAEREGGLADGVSAQDAAIAVFASTVGFEVLGAREPRWASRDMLSRFWELMLPRLAADGTLDGLAAAGTPGGTAVEGSSPVSSRPLGDG